MQEGGQLTPTINYGLQGWQLTPLPHLRDYYLGYAGRDYLGGQYPGSRTLSGAGYETPQQEIFAPGETANAKEDRGDQKERGDRHQAPPEQ